MERYYKVEKTSNTGVKIQEIENRVNKLKEDINILREKYGFIDHYYPGDCIRGLLSVVFENKPDSKLWKLITRPNGYYPKACNKVAYSNFKKIKSIPRYEIDRVIGINYIFNNCGFDFEQEDVYLFIVDSKWKIKIPDDLIEISNIEYMKYTGKE